MASPCLDSGSLFQSVDADAAAIKAQQVQMGASTLPQYVANRLLALSVVEYVFVSRQDEAYQIWTVVNVASEEEYDAIYSEEARIIADLQSVYFDFHVITRSNRALRDIVTFSCQGWRKSR